MLIILKDFHKPWRITTYVPRRNDNSNSTYQFKWLGLLNSNIAFGLKSSKPLQGERSILKPNLSPKIRRMDCPLQTKDFIKSLFWAFTLWITSSYLDHPHFSLVQSLPCKHNTIKAEVCTMSILKEQYWTLLWSKLTGCRHSLTASIPDYCTKLMDNVSTKLHPIILHTSTSRKCSGINTE